MVLQRWGERIRGGAAGGRPTYTLPLMLALFTYDAAVKRWTTETPQPTSLAVLTMPTPDALSS